MTDNIEEDVKSQEEINVKMDTEQKSQEIDVKMDTEQKSEKKTPE